MLAYKKFLLHIIESLGGFSLMRMLKRNQPVILMYHRIIDNTFINALTPEEFEKQIIYIQEHFKVVPLEELIADINSGNIKPNSLALTFDDGHYDFYTNAWPILKKYKLPASLYITTGFVDGTTWLWPDLLKYILLNSQEPELQTAALGPISTDKNNHHQSWHKLGDYCLTLTVENRNAFLQTLANAAGVTITSNPQSPFNAVTWAQLQEMQKDGLTLGSHTVTHPILSTLALEDLHTELAGSARAIEQHLGTPPSGICYPNGRPEDISGTVIKTAEKLGYTYGLMGRNSKLDKSALFRIGRMAANIDFFYFKWTLARREKNLNTHYIN